MIKIIVTCILLLHSSCALTPRIKPRKAGIDPVFKPYLDNYIRMVDVSRYRKRVDNLSINFADLEENTIGRCYFLFSGKVEIEIDTDYWYKNSDDTEKELTMYHELEHCIRYRNHTNRKGRIENIYDFFEEIAYSLGFIKKKGYLYDGCPSSLMHSHSIPYFCRQKHFNYYMKEMIEWKP